MDIKLDVNKLVDKLANAERTIGEQGKSLYNSDNIIRELKSELAKAKKEIEALSDYNKNLQESCKDADESIKFWYDKAIELGYELKVV